MAYRSPSTKIILYRDVPLDPDYVNTVYWDSEQARSDYFIAKLSNAISLDKQSYQRIENSTLRIQAKYEDVINYNYMSAQNESYVTGAKVFYCFITGANYVNENTCDITYAVDVMTTFFFDYSIQQCWVRREHQATDIIGDNIQPESLPLGDYVQNYEATGAGSTTEAGKLITNGDNARLVLQQYQYYRTPDSYAIDITNTDLMKPVIDVQGTVNDQGETTAGALLGGIYSGLHHHITSSADEVNDMLTGLTSNNKADSIVNIIMATNAPYFIYQHTYNDTDYFEVWLAPRATSVDGYTPKNNKLFTYPYMYLDVGTTSGSDRQQLRYEYFGFSLPYSYSGPHARLYADVNGNPTLLLVPQDYKEGGISLNGVTLNSDGTYNVESAADGRKPLTGDITHSVVLTNYPVCSYAIDGYRAWLAQNQWKIVGQLAGNLGTTALAGVGAMAGASNIGGVGLGMGLISSAANIAGEWMQASTLPPRAGGNIEGKNMSALFDYLGGFDFYSRCMSITADYARAIDDYFTRFGYATNRIKVPNRNVRPYWTYTETRDCAITGNLPSWAVNKIQSIYNKGITFWKDINNIGNFSLDNSL